MRTASPVSHSLLSATVIAPSCAQADAYATAFMVMGVDSAKAILSARPELSAYLIYEDADSLCVYSTIEERVNQ
jgi:thiamine biosynthesis lipoprotein